MESKMLEVLNQRCELIDMARKNGMRSTTDKLVDELVTCVQFFEAVTGKPLDIITDGEKGKVVYRDAK